MPFLREEFPVAHIGRWNLRNSDTVVASWSTGSPWSFDDVLSLSEIFPSAMYEVAIVVTLVVFWFFSYFRSSHVKRAVIPVLPPKPQTMKFDIPTHCHDQFKTALRHYRELKYPTIEEHTAILNAAVRCCHSDISMEVVRNVASQYCGKPPSVEFCEEFLRRFASRQWYDLIVQSSRIIDLPINTSRIVAGCLCHASVADRNYKRAMEAADALWANEGSLKPKEMMSFLISLSRSKMWREIIKVYEMLSWDSCTVQESRATNILNVVLGCVVNAKQSDLSWDLLQQAMDKTKAGVPFPVPDVVSFNTVLKGVQKDHTNPHSLDRALKLLDVMDAHDIMCDDITYGTVLDICILTNAMDKAAWVLDSLHKRGLQMNAVLYTTIIKGYIHSDRLDMAMETFDQMMKLPHALPDIVTFSLITRACVDNKKVEEALKLLNRLEEVNLVPDDMMVNNILEGCVIEGNTDAGIRLFEKYVVRGGAVPSAYTCTSMLKLYGKAGMCNEAFIFVESMKERFDIEPGGVMFTCLMSGAIRNRNYKSAWSVYELMVQRRIARDMKTYTTALAAAAGYPGKEADVRAKLEDIISQMRWCPGMPKQHTLDHARDILKNRPWPHLQALIGKIDS
eukprot:GEMP01009297.1.p1 GENE.GEMP01009297.1~~GEMP01009297.1.p1  ORF type:complete len:621 (+),score=124.37 GEMP01009297.1:1035-2897(+)